MKKNKEIKEMSLYEASDFRDQHDFGEFDDIKEMRDIKFSLKRKSTWGLI